MNVITISRQYGSRGAAIGAAVAGRLGWRYVDDDLVFLVAHRAGIDDRKVRAYDQEGFSRLGALAQDCIAIIESMAPTVLGGATKAPDAPDLPAHLRRLYSVRYFHLAQQMIRALAAHGRVVIMGRGAQLVLQGIPGTFHLRVVAPWDVRVRRVATDEGIAEPEAARRIRRRDVAVARYLHHFYRADWNDPLLYHMVLNTGFLSDTEAASLIVHTTSDADNAGLRESGRRSTAMRPTAESARFSERPLGRETHGE